MIDSAQMVLRVASRREEGESVTSFELVSDDSLLLPEFEAGAHVDVHMKNGLVRQYSICNDPSERHRYVLGILKERQSRGGSIFMHDNVQTGDFLSIGRPRCNFPLVESAELSVLIAGGIGATPLLAMAHRLAALGKPFAFHYCARNRSRIAFRDVLEHSPLVGSVTLHLSDGDAKQRFFLPDDVGLPERGVHIYICGPEGFIAKQLDQAAALGWPDDQVHVEFFNAQVRSEAGDQPIVVTAARSGVTVEVRANQTIANVLMESGVDVPVACEQGICGTCVTPILQGKPLHRDEYLSDAEKSSNKMMTICCSRAKSRSLVLDI